MIEEIKLLLPLLESTQINSVWLISTYIAIQFIFKTMLLGTFVYLVNRIIAATVKAFEPSLEKLCVNERDATTVNVELARYRQNSGYLHADDCDNIVKALRKGLEE